MKSWTVLERTETAIAELQAKIKRKCGDCRACCFTFANHELEKPEYKWCQHACEGGCAIYGKHPMECRGFFCTWLQGFANEEDRPDKVGVVFDIEPCAHLMMSRYLDQRLDNRVMSRVTQLREGAARVGRAKELVDFMSLQMPVVVRPFGRSDADVDLVVNGIWQHLTYVEFVPPPEEYVCWAEEPLGRQLKAELATHSLEDRKKMVADSRNQIHSLPHDKRPPVGISTKLIRPEAAIPRRKDFLISPKLDP